MYGVVTTNVHTLLDECMKSLRVMQESKNVYINWQWIRDMDDISTGPTYRFGKVSGEVVGEKEDVMFMRCMEQHDILGAQVNTGWENSE